MTLACALKVANTDKGAIASQYGVRFGSLTGTVIGVFHSGDGTSSILAELPIVSQLGDVPAYLFEKSDLSNTAIFSITLQPPNAAIGQIVPSSTSTLGGDVVAVNIHNWFGFLHPNMTKVGIRVRVRVRVRVRFRVRVRVSIRFRVRVRDRVRVRVSAP